MAEATLGDKGSDLWKNFKRILGKQVFLGNCNRVHEDTGQWWISANSVIKFVFNKTGYSVSS